jgi:adenylyltransferase/sulfurtransferase
MTENDYRLINLRYSCPLLRREDLQAGKVPTAPTIASIIGALEVQEALKLLHGLPVAAGEAMIWNGQSNNFYKTAYQRRENCLSHDSYPEPIELPLKAADATADELFAAAAGHFGGQRDLTLSLDRDLVVSLDCACGDSRSVMQPQQLVSAADAQCPKCGQAAKPQLEHVVESGTALAKESLSKLGIPTYDIVRISDAHEEKCFLLAGDRGIMNG